MKIAWRNLMKQKVFSLINVFGLALGMSAFFFINQYTQFHESFDRFHQGYDDIYRVGQLWTKNGEVEIDGTSNWYAAGPAFAESIPEIEEYARLREWFGSSVIRGGEKELFQDNIFFADKSFFGLFGYEWEKGDINTAFEQLNDVVISASAANKYFGGEDPIGQSIILKQNRYSEEYTIKGVIRIPENSYLQPEILLNYERFGEYGNSNWQWSDVYLFVRIQDGVMPGQLRDKFNQTMEPHAEIWRAEGYEVEMTFDRTDELHTTEKPSKIGSFISRSTLNVLNVASCAVLIMAWINFIQLSTSQALSRAKEVGIRRTMGSGIGTFFVQFVTEAFLFNLTAFALAYTLFHTFNPMLYPLLQLDAIPLETSTPVMQGILIALLGSLITGIYPALVFSKQNPGMILKSKSLNTDDKVRWIRDIIVLLQLILSCGLISGAVFIFYHLDDIQSRDPGYDMTKLITVRAPVVKDSTFDQRLQTFKNDLLTDSNFLRVTVTSDIPGKRVSANFTSIRKRGATKDNINSNWVMYADESFVGTYGLELAAGRNFTSQDIIHGKSFLLNESAVYNLGFDSPEKAIGAEMEWEGANEPGGYFVVGVIKDYHHTSLKEAINPTIYVPMTGGRKQFITVEVNQTALQASINTIKKIYVSTFGDNLFDYTFISDYYLKQYDQDKQLGQLISVFGLISLLIVSICLFGFAGTVLNKRRKEVSIRKVFGASISSLFVLLSKRFVQYILLSYVIAALIVFWLGQQWLSQYLADIQVNYLVLLAPLILISIIALSSIVSKMLKTVRINPVVVLKEEN